MSSAGSWRRALVRRSLNVIVGMLSTLAPAGAQTIPDGQLVGTVRDATGGAIVGAGVSVASPSLIGGPFGTTTGPAGAWRAASLPAGAYTLHVSAPGFRPVVREGLRLTAGTTLTVDVVLDVAGVAEMQRVEAPSPLVDVTTATVPMSLSEQLLLGLSTKGDIPDLINLVPGVAGDVAFGGTKRSNAIYVDGVDATDAAEQDPWLRFTQNWLQEVHIVGLGAEAEHGEFTGVAAHAVVRSGANILSGLGEYWTSSDAWVADNTRQLSKTLQRSFQPERIAAYWSLNGQLGGPLRRDRVWYFAGVDHTRDHRAPAGYEGAGVREENDIRAIAKVTAAVRSGGRLEGFLQSGRTRVANDAIGPLVEPAAAGQAWRRQLSWSVRGLAGLGRSWLFDLRYTGYDTPDRLGPQAPQTEDGPPGHYDLVTNVFSVNVPDFERSERGRSSVSASGTSYAASFLGRSHELKFGVEIERAHERTTTAFPGGAAYFDYAGGPYLVQFAKPSSSTADSAHVGAFVEDRLALLRTVTLQPGLRVDAFRGSTPGHDNVLATTPVSPRIGVAWDPRADHRLVVRAHFGRYTDPQFARAYSLTDVSGMSESVLASVIGPGVFEEIDRWTPSTNRRVDPSLKQSKVDQALIGAEQQILGNLSMQVQYIHRRFDHFMAYTPDGAIWVPVQRLDPGPDGVPGSGDDGQMFTVYSLSNAAQTTRLYTNPPGAWRRYDGLQFVARRRLADRWQLQASYTWSRSTGTIGNSFHANSGIRVTGAGDPNAQINGHARVGHDPTSEVKLVGTWTPTWLGGFTFGGVYRYMTGSAWGRTFIVRGLGQGATSILAEPRGTRRVDAISNLDLRIEKLLPLGGRPRLGVFTDVFNVTNQGVPDSDWAIPVVTTSGPSLGVPTYWRAPRQVRVAGRVTF